MNKSATVPEHVLNSVEEACESLGVEEISFRVRDLLNVIYSKSLYNGKSMEVTLGGAVFATCRSENVPVIPSVVADEFEITVKSLLNSSRYLLRNTEILEDKPIEWQSFIELIGGKLNISEEVLKLSSEIGMVAENNGVLAGRTPRGFATAAVYSAFIISDSTNRKLTQNKLSELMDISESTIRKTYKEQLKAYDKI